MPGIYRPRRPERTVLYRVLFHNFERFLTAYERRFEKDYGYFRPIVQEVVERYLDCGNPRSGFARIRCPDCRAEHLLTFSCKTRGFCPSCHAKRLEEWGEWVRETLLLEVPHRQVVFTIPKTLRIFFKFRRRLLGELCRSAVKTLTVYLERLLFLDREGTVGYRWGRDGAGQETEVMDYLEFIARVTSHIPDKGQVMVRYYGRYANA